MAPEVTNGVDDAVVVASAFLCCGRLKSFLTVGIMSAWTVFVCSEPLFFCATVCIVILFRSGLFDSCDRINVDTAEFFTALPAPRTTTSCSNNEFIRSCLETTCKNVVTRIILQTPSVTPWTLFRICHFYALAAGFVHPLSSGVFKKSGPSCTVSWPLMNTNRYPKSSTRLRIVDPVCSSTVFSCGKFFCR